MHSYNKMFYVYSGEIHAACKKYIDDIKHAEREIQKYVESIGGNDWRTGSTGGLAFIRFDGEPPKGFTKKQSTFDFCRPYKRSNKWWNQFAKLPFLPNCSEVLRNALGYPNVITYTLKHGGTGVRNVNTFGYSEKIESVLKSDDFVITIPDVEGVIKYIFSDSDVDKVDHGQLEWKLDETGMVETFETEWSYICELQRRGHLNHPRTLINNRDWLDDKN